MYIQKKSVGRLGGRCPGSPAILRLKEAVSKVFGTGFRGFGLLDIEVLRDELGKPWVRLHGGAKKLADSLKITRIHVSITNTGSLASAYAVGEGEWK